MRTALRSRTAPARAWLWERRHVIGGILLAKVAVLGAVALIALLLPRLFMTRLRDLNFIWQPGAPITLLDHYLTWDAQHYVALAEVGYAGAPWSVTYPPLWPAAIRATALLTGLSLPIAALAAANVLSAAGLLAFHRHVEIHEGRATADAAVALMLAWPTAFYLCLPYSEGLFLLLACGVLLSLRCGKLGTAAVLAGLASATRAVGVTLVVPFAVAAWERRSPRMLLAGLASVLGLLLHPALLAASGVSLQQFEAVNAMYVSGQEAAKAFAPLSFARELAQVAAIHRPVGSLLDRTAFLLALGAALLDLGRNRRRALWGCAMAYLPAATASFVSFTRYSLLVLPVHVTGARGVSSRGLLLAGLVLAGALCQGVLLLMHSLNLWVG